MRWVQVGSLTASVAICATAAAAVATSPSRPGARIRHAPDVTNMAMSGSSSGDKSHSTVRPLQEGQ